MTNSQSILQTALEALENGKLSRWEESFVKSIIEQYGTDKKALRNLSSKQFKTLRDIARKHS